MSGIEDKVVAITGASIGIGEATAVLLAGRGAKVVLGARGLERLEALTARLTQEGTEAVCARTDVKKLEEVAVLLDLACERFGRLDVLGGPAPKRRVTCGRTQRHMPSRCPTLPALARYKVAAVGSVGPTAVDREQHRCDGINGKSILS